MQTRKPLPHGVTFSIQGIPHTRHLYSTVWGTIWDDYYLLYLQHWEFGIHSIKHLSLHSLPRDKLPPAPITSILGQKHIAGSNGHAPITALSQMRICFLPIMGTHTFMWAHCLWWCALWGHPLIQWVVYLFIILMCDYMVQRMGLGH